MTEKRRTMRFSVSLPGEIEYQGEGKMSCQARLLDVSRNGLRLHISQKEFSKVSSVKIKLNLAESSKLAEIEGTVCWISPDKEGWHMGVQFDQIDPAVKTEILECGYHSWKNQMTKKP